jgi:hypothetical protein
MSWTRQTTLWDSSVVFLADGKLAPSDCFVTGQSNKY